MKDDTLFTDPVCGQPMDGMETAVMVYYDGEVRAFCSTHCMETFMKDPETFLQRRGKGVARAS